MKSQKVILEERLRECGIQVQDIVNRIGMSEDDKYTIIVYISRFEGLGNRNSDFDVYVLSEKTIFKETIMARINGAICDIEFWTYNQIFDMLSSELKNDEYKTIKLLKRMDMGLAIYNNSYQYKEMKDQLKKKALNQMIYTFFKSVANEEYDDAVKMFKCGEYASALTCARRCADNLIAAYNAKKEHANLNLKWAPKIFIENSGYGNTFILEGYKNYQLYMHISEENLDTETEELIDFLTDAIIQVTMEK